MNQVITHRDEPRRIVLDVDTGSDDAVAIMTAALAPTIDLLACTTVWGNLDVQGTTENTLAVLDLVGADDVPVYRGRGEPFAPVLWTPEENPSASLGRVHNIPLPRSERRPAHASAVEYLVESLRAATTPVTLVPVAPLSNIAAAISADPSIVDAVDEIVIMGGGHAVTNMTSSAESNIWHDPIAADVVVNAGFRRLVVVPLDATHSATLSAGGADQLEAAGTPASRFAADLVRQRMDSEHASKSQGRATLHDALCVAYLIDPSVVTLTPAHLSIETTGRLTYGRTVFDLRPVTTARPNSFVALSADGDRFLSVLADTLGSTGS